MQIDENQRNFIDLLLNNCKSKKNHKSAWSLMKLHKRIKNIYGASMKTYRNSEEIWESMEITEYQWNCMDTCRKSSKINASRRKVLGQFTKFYSASTKFYGNSCNILENIYQIEENNENTLKCRTSIGNWWKSMAHHWKPTEIQRTRKTLGNHRISGKMHEHL